MRKIISSMMGVLAAITVAASSAAQNYPSRPITMIVPFAAGGPTDAVAHIMSAVMRRSLSSNAVIANVTGRSGSVGVGRVAHAAPDGYTLLLGLWSTNVINGAVYHLPYDLVKDFEPIALLPNNPMLVVSNNAVPAKNLKELIAWAKAKPESGKDRHRRRNLGRAYHRRLLRGADRRPSPVRAL